MKNDNKNSCQNIALDNITECCPNLPLNNNFLNTGWNNKYILQHRIKELETDLDSNAIYTWGKRFELYELLRCMKERLNELTRNKKSENDL